jgi:hypothetical protein
VGKLARPKKPGINNNQMTYCYMCSNKFACTYSDMPVFASKSKNHHECLEVNQAWYKCTMTRKGAWKEIRLRKVHNNESIHAYHYIVGVLYWPHLVSMILCLDSL